MNNFPITIRLGSWPVHATSGQMTVDQSILPKCFGKFELKNTSSFQSRLVGEIRRIQEKAIPNPLQILLSLKN